MSHSPEDTSPQAQIEELQRQLVAARQQVQLGTDRYRMILDSAVDYAVIALDLNGLVLEWNEGARRLLGWTEAEMLGRSASLIFTEEDREARVPEAEMNAALHEGQGVDERWHQRKDGSRFWASGELMPLRNAAGTIQGFIKVLRDRTEQHQAAERHRADTEFLRSVLASSGDCIKVLDLDARLSFMNEGGQRVMEVDDFNAIRGCPWPEFWQDQGNHDARAAVAAACAGRSGHFRGVAATMAGTPRWWDVQVTPIFGADDRPERLLVVSRDITAMHAAEVALRASEERFRTILDTIEAAFAIVQVKFDADERPVDYRFVEANPAFERQAGVNLRGKWVTEFAPDLEQFWFETYGHVAKTGEPANFENYAEAFKRWFDVLAVRIGNPAERQIAIIFTDSTARRLAEERLRASEALARNSVERVQLALAAGAIIGTWNWDLSTDRVTVDDAFAYSFGLDPALGREGILSTQIVATVHPDDQAGLAAAMNEAIARGGSYAHQYRVRRTDGKYHWIEANGRVNHAPDGTPQSFPGVLLDVEERRAVEAERDRVTAELRALTETLEQRVEERTRELQDAKDFTRLALASVGGVGAWTYDPASDRFFCSPAISDLYGIDPAQGEHGISRVEFIANVHPDDKAALATTMSGGLKKSGDLELEYRIRHPDGSTRWVLSRGYTYHEDGQPIRRVGIGVETTKQHQLEDQLRQSQKMEAVGQLTGGLAHDFNNLLTGVTGSLELMQTRIAQGRIKDLDRYVQAAQGSAKRAAALTHRLLAFSRRQTLDPKAIDVNRLVDGMEDLIRRTVGPEIALELLVGAVDLWPTLVDPGQLENALLNLCINARDAMPDGGKLTVETANRSLDDRGARGRDLPSGDYVSLCVSDTGIGMSPDVIAKAFDPFFTTKPIGMGTGLGLSMIYGFAKQSGGQVRIHSEVGRGTTVCIYLPRHLGNADASALVHELADAPRAEIGQTVLVVDDEPTVRMLVTEVLEDLGYTAIEAADGAAGLKVLRSDVRLDLLVTDVGLPGGMNGRQVADAARVARPELKVLFITGYAENAVLSHGHLDAGMHVLVKPFAMEALASRIKELIGKQAT